MFARRALLSNSLRFSIHQTTPNYFSTSRRFQSLNSFIRSTGNLSDQTEIKNIIDLQSNDTLDGNLSMEDDVGPKNISRIKVQTEPGDSLIFCLPVVQKQPQTKSVDNLVLEIQSLFNSVNYQNILNQKLQEIETEINDIDLELKPLETAYDKIIQQSKTSADSGLLIFLSMWTMSFTSIARLTWWEYSWDIMEPVAWAVQAGGMLFWGWYYFVTKNENAMNDLSSRVYNKRFRKRLIKNDFDYVRYNTLVFRRKELEKSYDKLIRRGSININSV